jgi:hypothetical protein
LAAAQR